MLSAATDVMPARFAPVAEDGADAARPRLGPVKAILFGCLILQRFCIPLGGLRVPVATVVVAGLFGWLFARNRLHAGRSALLRYLLLAAVLSGATALSVADPHPVVTPSLSSVIYLLLLYSLLALRLHPAPGARETFAVFRGFMTFVACAACAQFLLQFAGLRFFSFAGLVPERFLLENEFNTVAPIGHGASFYRSNGVFFLEPSILSQFAAVSLVIELLYFRQALRVAVFAAALITAFSGTGLLVLGFALFAGAVFDGAVFLRAAKALVVAALLVAPFAVVAAPGYFDSLAHRSTEVQSENTSAFIRFVSPYVMVADLSSDPRFPLGFGPGTAERWPGHGGVNALTKVLLEYGIAGLSAFVLFLSGAFVRRDQLTLSAVCVFWFVFGGGYLLAPAVLYPIALLMTWGPGASAPTQLEREAS